MAYEKKPSSIKNIFTVPFTYNNSLEISLVKDTDPNLSSFKARHFCFVSCTPGVNKEGGGRTFDNTKKVTVKVDLAKLMALAKSIRLYAQGHRGLAQFQIFADPGKFGGSGTLKVCQASFVEVDADRNDPGKGKLPKVSIGISQGKSLISILVTPSEAMAIADIIEREFVQYGFDLEKASKKVQVGVIEQQPDQEYPHEYEDRGAESSYSMGGGGIDNPPF